MSPPAVTIGQPSESGILKSDADSRERRGRRGHYHSSCSRRRALVSLATFLAVGCASRFTRAPSITRPTESGFAWESSIARPTAIIADDLQRFGVAYEAIARGASGLDAMQKYMANGTAGLRAYLMTYGVTPADLLSSIDRHPRLYWYLARIRDQIETYGGQIIEAVQELQRLAPRTPGAPIFFFVGATGHGATVKEVTREGGEDGLGVLIPVELIAMSAETQEAETAARRAGTGLLGDLPQLASHEFSHIAQIQLQGLDRYRSIYRDRSLGTHLAYAVREGGADFLAHLASGQIRERHHYLLTRERELWLEFSSLLNRPAAESQGWFSGRGEEVPDRPPQMGYAIGWSICVHFYRAAGKSSDALRQILSAVEPANFEHILAPYRRRFG